MTREVECWTSDIPGTRGEQRLTARDVETGFTLSTTVESGVAAWGTERHAREDLIRQLEQHVRMMTWFALSCSSTGVAPVFYAGGPLNGTWEDQPLSDGGKPPLRHRIVRSPRFEPAVYAAPAEFGEPDGTVRPPAIFEYERSMHPVMGDLTRPMAWRYLHVGAY